MKRSRFLSLDTISRYDGLVAEDCVVLRNDCTFTGEDDGLLLGIWSQMLIIAQRSIAVRSVLIFPIGLSSCSRGPVVSEVHRRTGDTRIEELLAGC